MEIRNSQSKSEKITSRIAYTFGAFGNDVFYAAMSTYLINFITSHLFDTGDKTLNNHLVSAVTLIIMVLRIVELLIDPFIGNAIDRTKTRWGHFRPWVVIGGTVSSIALLALFSNMGGLTKTHPWLYLVIFAFLYIAMDIFYSFKDVGFWSMLPALSFDSREREKTATFARIGSSIGGSLVGVVVMPLVLFFSLQSNGGTGDDRGWFWFGFIVAAVAFVTALAVGIGTREVDNKLRENKEDTAGVSAVFKMLVKNDQLMWVALAYLLYGVGINLVNALELYYFQYIMGDPKGFSLLQFINMFVGIFAVSAFPKLADKLNRKPLFIWCLVTMLIGIGLFTVAGKSLLLVLIAAELFYIPQPIVFLVVLMIITDSVEYGQWKLGHRDESLALSVRPLVDKFGGAVSNGVVGQIAVLAGMTTGATAASITMHQQMVFKFMMFGVPAIFILIGMFVFWKKITLTEERHAEIVAELEKTWGDQFDQSNAENDKLIKSDELTAMVPVAGKVIAMKDVPDEVFSTGKMGQGIAIKPTDGKVYAPFDAEVKTIFATRHAIGLVSDNGIPVLIHVGIGTVSMKGTGFVTYVREGQHVKKGQQILEFWDPAIKKAGLDDTVLMTFTHSDLFKEFDVKVPVGSEVVNTNTAIEIKK